MMKIINKKRGRPLTDGSKDVVVRARCGKEEKGRIERAARINGVSLSEFIRFALYNASDEVIKAKEKELHERFGGGEEEYFDDYYYEDEDEEGYLE